MTMQRLSGWGRTAWTVADLIHTTDVDEIRSAVTQSNERGVIARGLGRSYGAASQNAGGVVLELTAENDPMGIDADFDPLTGVLTVASSVSIDAILRMCVPQGWFIPVTPGTRFVTVGGAIASDIHGKNHHFDGSFGQHVRSITVMLSSGEVVDLSPQQNPAWFWATVGGMGLTGVILSATISMLKIETSRVQVETVRLENFDAVCAAMGSDGVDDDFRYSVCWIDLLATGSAMGRGVLTRGDHAPASAVAKEDSLAYDPRLSVSAPSWVPNGLLNKWSIKVFNEAWYRKAPSKNHVGLESIPAFFHPLDGVNRWNRLYGKQGFIQYQFIVPLDRTDVLRKVIEKFSAAGVASFLAVLKRMGVQNDAPMSFPTEGWTLTLDMAAGITGLAELLADVDEMVLDAGGRHYLAKDSHVSANAVRRGYPRLDEWMGIQEQMDTQGVWRSDLSRRLGLVDHRRSK